MLYKHFNKKQRTCIAWILLFVMTGELVVPNVTYALSGGPVQPEIASFEPVGTTDMVDMFTGDFVYNIPLMDVEGYPINIAYHGGVGMEQEASWVGLGWNISPGAINRGVRGLPDEFAGDTIEKEMNIKPEINKKIGMEAGAEFAGVSKPILNVGLGLGGYVTISNYKGVGVDFTTSAGINTSFKFISAGVNVGASIGSQSGAAIDYGASVGVGASQAVNNDMSASGSFNLNAGGVYSPRTGHKQNVGYNMSASLKAGPASASFSTGTSVQIGLQNYTAAVTNPCYQNSYSGQLKMGGELYSVYLNGKVNGSYTEIKYEQNGSRKGFGYYNLDKSCDSDLVDFSREKDGNFNPTMQYLPQSHLTYDVYSVTGQGTGGSFRPFRNDIGSIYDPYTKSPESSSQYLGVEVGLGNLFEAGTEYTRTRTNVESGPWDDYQRKFSKNNSGYNEAVYFKEAGELTENNETYMNDYGNDDVIKPEDVKNIPLTKSGAEKRVVRANHIFTHTGADEDTAALVGSKSLVSYTDTTGFATYPVVHKTSVARVDNDPSKQLKRKPQQVTEIVQVQKDGRRYVYGLPVLNNVQREVTFAANISNNLDRNKNLVGYTKGSDDSKNNQNGIDNFYSSTVTPTYVAAHLLTGVLSQDYVDVTGNGISDDDLGTYTKINYTRKSADYRWRSPMESGKAQYIPGYVSDKRDDKASYVIGSREEWLVHSIETRNYVAEFFVSPRKDAKGTKDEILGNGPVYHDALYKAAGLDGENKSYKLDSIVLFNKHDRFMNGAQAQAIKTVLFTYDYSLCQGLPNAENGEGKLTLRKVQIKYGTSNINLSAGYSFNYNDGIAGLNPNYNIAEKDRWGSYKKNDPAFNNYECPYTTQAPVTDDYAKAWSLSDIHLPSGGVIKVDYEADDYAYVQDKLAMEMFKVTGMGNSPAYQAGANQLYFSEHQQNYYFYFKRRKDAENPQLTFRENYLKETNVLYYNIPVELADSKYEPIKGYAEVAEMNYCNNDPASDYGYVKLAARSLEGTGSDVNPVVFTALNLGRYSLPQVLFPGANPDETNMANVVAGLKNSIKELFQMGKNPLKYMIQQGKAQDADLVKSYIRMNSPGLKKKGGGQRVKSVKFYDNWDAMAGGKPATYGKQYDYTMVREDGKGSISSGVASYEPLIGGDEIPQRLPVGYIGQKGSRFPPNDPVDLFQEEPIGESFYPAPVVGYRRITDRSINIDSGRSSQSMDVHLFYTAKDFPTQVKASPINTPNPKKDIGMTSMSFEQKSTQGFSILLNDMHGKPRATEHWVLKPAGGVGAKELVNSTQYDYHTSGGQLDNNVRAFDYDGPAGQMNVKNKKMGLESDLTIDNRSRKETADMKQLSISANGFIVGIIPIVVALPIPFTYGNNLDFKCATVTKVTQQYGILDRVTNNNQGAVTTVKNEVFDAQTGNALVTSVNNEYGDREYSVSYPAHWAYRELGPSYENQDVNGTFSNGFVIDTVGMYGIRFVNYNTDYNYHYSLPIGFPIARVTIDEEMPKFKVGDELLLQRGSGANAYGPLKVWVMGYTSDIAHCYLVLATREPYKQTLSQFAGGNTTIGGAVSYRIIRSGNRNRLGETIQSYTTTDSNNIFPYLKDKLGSLVSLSAQTYNHKLGQVYAANTTSDSLNPFVTGKVGMYRPEQQIVNIKKREYLGGTTRNAGTFTSKAYWKTEKDNFAAYCPDSTVTGDYGRFNLCDRALDEFKITYAGGDDMRIEFTPTNPSGCHTPESKFLIDGYNVTGTNTIGYQNNANSFSFQPGQQGSFIYTDSTFVYTVNKTCTFYYSNGCCTQGFGVERLANGFKITRTYYLRPNPNTGLAEDVTSLDYYRYHAGEYFFASGAPGTYYDPYAQIPTAYRVRRKITLGKVGHYEGTDGERWVRPSQVTKYNWYGEELENLEQGVGYNSAVYGYNQQLPVCVSKNAKHSEVLFEPFEDFDLLQPKPDKNESYMPLWYSPFVPIFTAATTALGTDYKLNNATAGNLVRTKDEAHTGNYSLFVNGSGATIPLNASGKGVDASYSFTMTKGKKYVASVWVKTGTTPVLKLIVDTSATANSPVHLESVFTAKSNVIDGWQQYEVVMDIPDNQPYKRFELSLSAGAYYDDLRIYPFESNSKGFVYHPVTRKLMATLDENNYATFYEYDAEGNLVRTKKETDKGILTISESRSTHRKL